MKVPPPPGSTYKLTAFDDVTLGQLSFEIFGFVAETAPKLGLAAAPHLVGVDCVQMLFLYLNHMLVEKGHTLDYLLDRSDEMWQEYLDWTWPAKLDGIAGTTYYKPRKNSGEPIDCIKSSLHVFRFLLLLA